MFWRVFRSLNDSQRGQFIEFGWGRSVLPDRASGVNWKFKFSLVNSGDAALFKAHTCFFNVEVPKYTDDSIMRRRLLTTLQFGLGVLMED